MITSVTGKPFILTNTKADIGQSQKISFFFFEEHFFFWNFPGMYLCVHQTDTKYFSGNVFSVLRTDNFQFKNLEIENKILIYYQKSFIRNLSENH